MEVLVEALDDHLAAVLDGIDQQTDGPEEVALDHDHQPVFGVLLGPADAEEVGQAPDRQIVAAQFHHFAVPGHGGDLPGLGPDILDHRGQRQDEPLTAQPHHHPVEDRERQRQDQHEAGALARDRPDLQAAAQPFDVGADDVHPDAATRDVADACRGRETGRADQLVDLLVGQDGIGRDQAAFDRAGADRGAVDPGAVVLDPDNDPPALLLGGKADGAVGGLAGREPHLGLLDTMVDRVADHVGQRIADPLDHALVDLRPLALHLEGDTLAGLRAKFAQQARNPAESLANGLGTQAHHRILDLPREARKLRELDLVALGGSEPVVEDRIADDELADQVEQPVELRQVDPDRHLPAFTRTKFGLARGRRTRRFHQRRGLLACQGRPGRRRKRVVGRPVRFRHVHQGFAATDLDQRVRGDEIETIAHFLLGHFAWNLHRPRQITLFGVHLGERRKLALVDPEDCTSQPLDFAQDQHRLGAIGHGRGRRPEADVPWHGRRERFEIHEVEVDRHRRESELVLALCRCRDRFGRHGRYILLRVPREGFARIPRKCRVKLCRERRVGRRIGAIARRADMVGQHVAALQQQLQQGRGRLQPPGPKQVEHIFEAMREAEQRFVAKRPRPALDRMHRAEHRGDGLGLAVAGGKRAQALLGGGEALGAFLEENRLDGVEILVHGHTRRMAAASLSASNGLVIQPVAPASRARVFLSSVNSVDSTRIGRLRSRSEARMASISSNPSMRGMLMSVMIRSGGLAQAWARPSTPSSAQSMANPCALSEALRSMRMLALSSTVRMRRAAVTLPAPGCRAQSRGRSAARARQRPR